VKNFPENSESYGGRAFCVERIVGNFPKILFWDMAPQLKNSENFKLGNFLENSVASSGRRHKFSRNFAEIYAGANQRKKFSKNFDSKNFLEIWSKNLEETFRFTTY